MIADPSGDERLSNVFGEHDVDFCIPKTSASGSVIGSATVPITSLS
jgi:hypothetical protein